MRAAKITLSCLGYGSALRCFVFVPRIAFFFFNYFGSINLLVRLTLRLTQVCTHRDYNSANAFQIPLLSINSRISNEVVVCFFFVESRIEETLMAMIMN